MIRLRIDPDCNRRKSIDCFHLIFNQEEGNKATAKINPRRNHQQFNLGLGQEQMKPPL